jgi:acylphosphatase
MTKGRALIRVEGRVQKVGFRRFCEKIAKDLDLKGLAKNLSDGGVEVIIEGERESIERFLERIRNARFPAKVDKIDINWGEFKDEFRDFNW